MKGNYLIAMLTDFGVKDGFVGTMKGVIYSINPYARIVDISNDISPQNILEASYVLKISAKYFPEHTIFLAVVDPGVGSSRKAIIIRTSKFLYVCPDNGILSWIDKEEKEYEAIEITNKNYFLPAISHTFHGRDIFAPVSSYLSLGIDPYLMGKKIDNIKTIPDISPICEKNKASGNIIYIDRFGNLITNFSEDFFVRQGIDFKNITIEFKDNIINKLSNSYSENPQGSLLAVIGSSGHIELAVNQGNAKERFQCNTGDEVYCKW